MSQNHEDGVIVGRHSLLRYDVQIPGRAWPWDGVGTLGPQNFEPGETVKIGFLKGNPQLPFIITQKEWSFSPRGQRVAWPDHFADWLRLGVRSTHRWFASDWDNLEAPDSAIVFAPDLRLSGAGTIVRTDSEGKVWWADGAKLRSRPLAGGADTEEDFVAQITLLHLGEITGRPYCGLSVVNTGGGGDEYEAGYTAGYDAGSESPAFPQGAADCLGELGYRVEEMASGWVSLNMPGSGSPEYLQGWSDGAVVRYTELYRSGYESEGCEVPEE